MISEDKKNWAVEMLREKAKELERMPKKDDFDDVMRSRIKAYLGPWPRALEAAGLKPIRDPMKQKGHNQSKKKKNKKISEEEKEI